MEPFFLAGERGRLFLVHHPPASGAREDVLVHLPAFCEEMNKSRRMVALRARALAASGVGVVVPDLYGTGDSEGDFGHATWTGWHEDLAAVVDWARGAGYRRVLAWGLRGGALLVEHLRARAPLAGVVLWNPVVDGRNWLSQFLRVRTVARSFSGEAQETVKGLLGVLQGGQAIEVAGYELAPELAIPLAGRRLGGETPLGEVPVAWLQVSPEPQNGLPPPAAAAAARLAEGGARLTETQVAGDPFWTTQEITTVPELIEATRSAVQHMLRG